MECFGLFPSSVYLSFGSAIFGIAHLVGSAHALSGICNGLQITGFLRDAGSQKRRKFRPEPPGVRRMRRTGVQGWTPWACAEHGSVAQWIHGVPENK
jgi:hypothetical protein